MGLLNAAKRFDPSQGSSFGSFAALCIHRRLASAVAKQSRHGREISLSQMSPQEEEAFSKVASLDGDIANSPENLVIRQEDSAAWQKKLDSLLSPKEQKIVQLYLEDLSYQDIAQRLNTTVKAVDNGLQRVKRKLKDSVLREKSSD